MLSSSDKDFSSRKYFRNYTEISDAIMKVLLLVLLSVIGITTAQYDSFCTESTGMYLVPHPTDCASFLQCIDSVATVHTCLDGKWFDENLLICRLPSVAACSHLPSSDVPEYILEICSTMPVGQTIPAVACNKYYTCQGTKAFELTCPNGQHYSRAYSACMNPLEAGCRALNTMCVGEYPGFAFPSLTCESYYVCGDDLMPQAQHCDTGLYFSANLQNCTTPELSGCVNAGEGVTTPGGCEDPNAPVCNSTNTGSFYPHPLCNWFYMCYNSVAKEFQCDCGQYYDATLKYCIEDKNGVCSS